MKWPFLNLLGSLVHQNKTKCHESKYVGGSSIKPSQEQLQVCKELEHTNQHSFVTGRAGTGKSVVLKYFVAHTRKKVVVVAPTGIAALSVNGQTIHSLFKLNPGFIDVRKLTINDETKQLLRHVDAIVIDEISMVRADTLDGIDCVLRAAKQCDIPFGGAQIIAFGDVYQLPPIVETAALRRYFSNVYAGPYFFDAVVWKHTVLRTFELQTIFRQSDATFKSLLDNVRDGQPTETDFLTLKSRSISGDIPLNGNYITLTTTNAAARRINTERLEYLKKKPHTYHATITGQKSESSFPAEVELTLKVGAQVVLLKNDPDKRWINGTVGKIKFLSKDSVSVAIGRHVYIIKPETWEKSSYYYDEDHDTIEQEVTSIFTQFPLKLAWAITIHKSQGCTYDKVVVDICDGAFVHGQTYVALSRCRSLQGLYIRGEITLKDIIVEPAITNFMRRVI